MLTYIHTDSNVLHTNQNEQSNEQLFVHIHISPFRIIINNIYIIYYYSNTKCVLLT